MSQRTARSNPCWCRSRTTWPQEVGPDAAAPARRIDIDLVDLAEPGFGVVIAGHAPAGEADDAVVDECHPGLAIGRLDGQLVAPEVLARLGAHADGVFGRHETGMRLLPAGDIDMGDARGVSDGGAAEVDGALAGHRSLPRCGVPWRHGRARAPARQGPRVGPDGAIFPAYDDGYARLIDQCHASPACGRPRPRERSLGAAGVQGRAARCGARSRASAASGSRSA